MCLICLTEKLPQPIYCERGISTNLFAEPLNAFSNLSFFIASFLAHKFLKKNKIKDKKLLILPLMLFTIGAGSILFHTARNSMTLILDTLPIYIFIVYSLFLVLADLLGSKLKPILILIAYIALQILLTIYMPKEFLNGSFRHLTTISLLLFTGWFTYKKYGNKILKPLFTVFGFYAVAIFTRTIDLSICPIFPIGTHFLWHILNAFAGYFAIVLLTKIKTLNR